MGLSEIDRRAGDLIRARARAAGLDAHARRVADALAPAFKVLVAVWIARRSSRRSGVAALASSVTAALAARALRDAIGRPRPGPRAEGGFPSRHAAAATAIARVAARRGRAGTAVGTAAAVGLAGRVASGEHEPLDIVAGAALGAVVEAAVARVIRGPSSQ